MVHAADGKCDELEFGGNNRKGADLYPSFSRQGLLPRRKAGIGFWFVLTSSSRVADAWFADYGFLLGLVSTAEMYVRAPDLMRTTR